MQLHEANMDKFLAKNGHTVGQEILTEKKFACLIFTLLYFRCYDYLMKNNIGQNFTHCTKINTQLILTLTIRGRKYSACLIFVVEGDCRNFI